MQGFTCGYIPGTEEEGSSWPSSAETGCKVAGAEREGTSRSRRCMEVEDLSLGREIKKKNSLMLFGCFPFPVVRSTR